MPKTCIGKCLQHSHHGGRNAGAADKRNDAIPSSSFFTIKTNDETSHHPNAIGGDAVD